ncbi:MAG: MoxR family ATPase [Acidobacteriota bacterium]|nr:MoxR family ATPase [Acidobacteriota bacterium]
MTSGESDRTTALKELHERVTGLRSALGELVVGQDEAVLEILIALLCGGHVLLEGVPGIAKTLLARSLTSALGLEFRRIQFTPDLTPADVTGTNLFDFQSGTFHLQKGPVFTNILLADEINRTPPKTQSALLEAMEERQVTIDGVSHPLAAPFFVIATQNPLEHEGTYPLPEAQLDRFLIKVEMTYPVEDEELEIYRRFLDGRLGLSSGSARVNKVLDAGDIARTRDVLEGVHVEDKMLAYLKDLVVSSRRSLHLSLGASPRAGMALLAASRARAALAGRDFVIPDDVKRMAGPVLRHRLLPTPEAELEGMTASTILERLVGTIEVPR